MTDERLAKLKVVFEAESGYVRGLGNELIAALEAERAQIARVLKLCDVVETDTMRERPWSEEGCFQRGIHANARVILAAINGDAP